MTSPSRENIDELIAVGEAARARAQIARYWFEQAGPAAANFVLTRLAKLPEPDFAIRSRVAFLRSFTVEPLVPLLRAMCALNGLHIEPYIGPFNAYAQEIFDGESELYKFQAQMVFLALQLRDVAAELGDDFADCSPRDASMAAERVVAEIAHLIGTFRGRSNAHLVIHRFETPAFPASGIFDQQRADGQRALIDGINAQLRELAARFDGVHTLDYDAVIARCGKQNWHDPQKWRSVRMPMKAAGMLPMAEEWARYAHALSGRSSKVLVLDLDNTLWKGVIGEDGMAGIQVGPDDAGEPFLRLQRVALNLARRGILLAIASKNNPAEALQALDEHEGMLLRSSHFAALRINWSDKAANLKELAAELNLGTDSLAFLDDNPVERQWVREQMPEVAVIEIGEDPETFADTLARFPIFETLRVSEEDRARSQYYAGERERREIQQNAASLPDFYRSLEMRVAVEDATDATIPRIAQLTQKTNQFNLTTRRYSEQEIHAFVARGARVYAVRARDRFGDNGIIAAAITINRNGICEIDTFLMSCRVIGRTVETSILSAIVDRARLDGARRIRGEFIPTRKNAPARELYPSHGFILLEESGERIVWELAPGIAIACPEWIELETVWEEVEACNVKS